MLFEIYALTIYQKIIYIMKETQRHIRIMNKTWKWSSIKSTSGLFVACTSKTRGALGAVLEEKRKNITVRSCALLLGFSRYRI